MATNLTRASPGRGLRLSVFDRKIKAMQRARVQSEHCHLHRLTADQIIDRRTFVKRESQVILEVGAGSGWLFRRMIERNTLFGVKQYIQTDISEERLNANYKEIKDSIPPGIEFVQICSDEDEPNPFGVPAHTIDMCVSNLTMHWVNDLEGAMVSIRTALKRDGLLMMAMFGGNTLFELRSCFSMAQMESLGGLSPFVSPLIDGTGISGLTLQTGFSLPTIDMDRHVLLYESPVHLMYDLQCTGESACHVGRKKPLTKGLLACASALYSTLYQKHNLVPATFEIFHVIAWSPHPSQPQALQRGAGMVPLNALSTAEHKDLTEALDDFAKNPDDHQKQEKAEQLYDRLLEKAKMDEAHTLETKIVPKDQNKAKIVAPPVPNYVKTPSPPESTS